MYRNLLSAAPLHRDAALLLLRLFFGFTMMWAHGWAKLTYLANGETDFVDVFGMGEPLSLSLAIFAEFICAALVAIGCLTRLATIPLIITMAVAAFHIHWNDGFGKMELALIYLTVFIVIFLAGPGRFAVDSYIRKNVQGHS